MTELPDTESMVTITDSSIVIDYPESEPPGVEFRCKDSPGELTHVIDFFHGRPALYLYEPGKEEPQFGFLLPTEDDPTIKTLKRRDWENNELYETLRND